MQPRFQLVSSPDARQLWVKVPAGVVLVISGGEISLSLDGSRVEGWIAGLHLALTSPIAWQADLSAVHGLTAAECAVILAVADGIPPERVAAHRGVSIHTVRNQIKAGMSKLGIYRQSDLVRRIETMRRGG